jgi:hypothetical protein
LWGAAIWAAPFSFVVMRLFELGMKEKGGHDARHRTGNMPVQHRN